MFIDFHNDQTFEKGAIEFHGVWVERPDGSFQIPMVSRLKWVKRRTYWCEPAGLVPESTIDKIIEDLSNSIQCGHTDGYSWRIRAAGEVLMEQCSLD